VHTSLSRRHFIRTLGLGSGAVLLAACAQQPPSPAPAATSAPAAKPAAPAATTAPAAPAATTAPAAPAAGARRGGVAVVGLAGNPDTLNPMFTTTAIGRWVQRLYSDGLVLIDADGNIQKALAESWTAAPDLKQFTFKLHANAKFHDGQPVTTADVKYTFEQYAHPDYERTRDEVLRIKGAKDFRAGKAPEIAGIKAVDAQNVSFELDEPDAFFFETAQLVSIFPKHVLEKIPAKDLKASDFTRQPMASGPFKVVAWKEKESVIFEAFPDYHLGKPALDQVVIRLMPESATIASELKTGGVHLGLIQPEQQQAFSREAGLTVTNVPGTQYYALRYDNQNPFFADPRVRKAINFALDRDAILKGLAGGLGTLTNSHLHPSVPEYNPNVKGYAYQPDQAKSLLDDAGWKAGGDGIRTKDGKPFSVEHVFTAGNAVQERHALLIQQQLKEVGIDVKVNPVDASVFTSTYYKPGKFETMTSGWNNLVIPPYSEMLLNFSTNGYHNVDRYSRPEVDQMITTIPNTADAAKRKEIFWKLQDLVSEDASRAYGVRPDDLVAVSKSLNVPTFGSFSGLMLSARNWSLNQ
jgi:peptide/nickel transport system substrate-binding protein